MSCEVRSEEPALDGLAVRKSIELRFEGPGGAGRFGLLLYTPARRAGPAPAFLLISHKGRTEAELEALGQTAFWPVRRLLLAGFATAAFLAQEIDPDEHDGFRNGVHGLFDGASEPRPGDAWGTIAAWAWGASRAMDCLLQDPAVDGRRIAVLGHSRGGKTALWAGANDPRFALVISNNSGCTGAALARGKRGETIRLINERFPHWFCGNYKAYGDREHELPVDQHMLLALIAPRAVYVTSATNDAWAIRRRSTRR